jgi:hypothetical protein
MIANWQESHCGSNICTVVLQVDASDKQKTMLDICGEEKTN